MTLRSTCLFTWCITNMSINLDPPISVSNADELRTAVQQQPQAWLEFLLRVTNFSANAQELITTLETDKATALSSLEQVNITLSENAITMAAGQAVIDELRTNLIDASQSKSHRSTKHPDPSSFGGDKAELRGWMTQLRIKLNINKDHYPTEQSKLAYALSRLKERALNNCSRT